MSEEQEMSFLEHLEELRWHIIRSLIAVCIVATVAFFFPKIIFDQIIFGPVKVDFVTFRLLCDFGNLYGADVLCIKEIPVKLQSKSLPTQFIYHIVGSLVVGFVVAFPYVFWEIWRFISPGLHQQERKNSRGAVFFVSLLFLIGISFGYFIILPLSINFLSNHSISEQIENIIHLDSYISFALTLVLMCGLVFQLPIVVYFLSKTGLVTPKVMREYRKHAFVAILVLGALITPPDIFSQLFIAFPLYGLYEMSISISAWVVRKEMEEEERLERERMERERALEEQAKNAAAKSDHLGSIGRNG